MSAFDPITYRRGDVPVPLPAGMNYWTAPEVAGRVFEYDDLATRVTLYPADPELGDVKVAVLWPWWLRLLIPPRERTHRLTVIYSALEVEKPLNTRLSVVAA